jgi:hypothetical protein
LRCFYVLKIWVCNFLAKAAHKMLVKLTPGRTVGEDLCPTAGRGCCQGGDELRGVSVLEKMEQVPLEQ